MGSKFVAVGDLWVCLGCGCTFVDTGGNITYTEYANEEGRTRIFNGHAPCCGSRRPEVASVCDIENSCEFSEDAKRCDQGPVRERVNVEE